MNRQHQRSRGAVAIGVRFHYPVIFTHHVFDPTNDALAQVLKRAAATAGARIRVFLDAGLVAAQPRLPAAVRAYGRARCPALAAEAPACFPGGEPVKAGLRHVNRMVADLAARHFCRHSVLVAVGGGAFLDAAGLAAALVHRGVRLVRLPSTTLSQDDSGVGTKNGVNLLGQKNFIGTFAPPFAVVNDLQLLRTLPPALVADGLAEAFKVALIKSRRDFDYLCRHAPALARQDWGVIERVVRRTAALHAGHIVTGGDPFELGGARPLDFGHWSAHRLESLSGYRLRHGQAVAVGIALDSWYAWQTGRLRATEFAAIVTAMRRAGLPLWHPLLARRDAAGRLLVLDGLEQFREHLGGRLAITLPCGLGRKTEIHTMDRRRLARGIAYLEEHFGTEARHP